MPNIFPAQTDKDYETAKKLFVEYADSLGFHLRFQNFEEELANLPGDYVSPSGCLLLAVYKEQPVGCVALRKRSDGICEMKRLYVREQFRGLGIGRALVEAVIEEARKIGYNYMRLDTVPSMEAASALYVSVGFKKSSAYRYNPIEDAVFMELKLV
ncbi:MAG: GNAT family N-acetyltransferase [Planctomycetes bacterium]|nr:GNAT family N-acetyltransferase [Planctomycetota bacterium]